MKKVTKCSLVLLYCQVWQERIALAILFLGEDTKSGVVGKVELSSFCIVRCGKKGSR